MQPFFNKTRASMTSWPTTNWRCSRGFRSSSSTELQGMCFISSFFAPCLTALPLLTTRGLATALLILLSPCFAFAILVPLPGVDSHCLIVQITVCHLQGLGFGHFPFRDHLRQGRRQGGPRRLYAQPVALFGT